ncbi:DNA/RNA non-specific endonuclease [Gordonia sp. 852002-50395_SCH5434458]|uniref:DNA/RNA non-specific endonuclease n=1 Tax=Gordonia sp. 852002-50395_SCH5434458 TaxID=1834090 RepID=UPI0007EBEBF4|nr:DNA/RNA non-specific endonuclease [Gordonia sp. 852002-50395_SCH5434458]OBC02700.1 hypothetical protein A5785_02490 [Gordonia sp. 852002-50395_SCH5434458]
MLALFLGAFLVAGMQTAPVFSAKADAATNCSTLPSRIASFNSEARTYNAQVAARNARGGGTPAEVAYYNSWRSRLVSRGQTLNAELSRCKQMGQAPNVAPPVGPGAKKPQQPAPGPRPPRQQNPTPGFPMPEKYRPGQGVVKDETTLANGRRVVFKDGGTAEFGGLNARRASQVQAKVSRGMLNQGSRSRSKKPNDVTPRGFGGNRTVRGHLLAQILGGKGGDARNIVPLTVSANGKMRTVERQVYEAVKRCGAGKVDYYVIPNYGPGPVSTFGSLPYPDTITMVARGCGLNLNRTISNR